MEKWLHFPPTKRKALHDALKEANIDPLAAQAFASKWDRPKFDVYDACAVLAWFAFAEDQTPRPVTLLITPKAVFTFGDLPAGDQRALEAFFADHPEILDQPGRAAHYILQKLAYSALALVDAVGREIDAIEQAVYRTPFENEIGYRIFRWKRRLRELRNLIEAESTVLKAIAQQPVFLLRKEDGFDARAILEHVDRVVEAFDTFRETLSAIFDLQISLKSDHMNAIMKTLTMVSVIFLPMSFIAGVYGMNFEHMPELKWRLGYAYALALMFGVGIGIVAYFKRKGWW